MKKILIILLVFIVLPNCLLSQSNNQIDTTNLTEMLMHNTFLISGNGSCGTVFILGKIKTSLKNSKKKKSEAGNYQTVLITAAHVLDSMIGNKANLYMRSKEKNGYKTVIYPIIIRNNKSSFYIKHPTMDIAAMNVTLPDYYEYPKLATSFLSNDSIIDYWRITTGEIIDCLGFPLCPTDSIGTFPVLRTGKIASYPLTPSNIYKSFLFDFEIYNGNSGGPVIFQEARSRGRVTAERTFSMDEGYIQFILGLITDSIYVQEKDQSGKLIKKTEIKMGSVIQARFILETINLLP